MPQAAELKPVWKSPKLSTILDVAVGTDPKGSKKTGFFVLQATGADGKGRTLEFFAKADASPVRLVDETGTEWDFTGKGTSGPLAGRQLRRTAILNDYWFDWKIYHPDSNVYQQSEPRTN